MSDRFDVVAIRIEDKGRIVARMVLRAKPGTSVVASARCECLLVEGIHAGAVLGGKRDVDGLARITLADPEVRLASPSKPCRGHTRFHDKLVAQRREGFCEEALALFEIRHANSYVIQHYSHLPRPPRPNGHLFTLVSPATRSPATATFQEFTFQALRHIGLHQRCTKLLRLATSVVLRPTLREELAREGGDKACTQKKRTRPSSGATSRRLGTRATWR